MTHGDRALDGGSWPADLRRLRSIAAHLIVDDPNRADELVQETCLTVLRTPPQDPENLLPWLVGVLRNLSRTARRSERRRAVYERQAPSLEPGPEPLACAVRNELLDLLAEEFRGLREPFRETLALRYFESLEPSAIARRMDVPAATVRSRLKRGLAELRLRLDARTDRRATWKSALSLFVLRVDRQASALAGASARATSALVPVLAAVATALVVLGLVPGVRSWFFGSNPPPAVRLVEAKRNGSFQRAERLPTESQAGPGFRSGRGVDPDTVRRELLPRPPTSSAASRFELHGRLVGLDPKHPWSTALVLRAGAQAAPLLVPVDSEGAFVADLSALLGAGRASVQALILEANDPAYLPARQSVSLLEPNGQPLAGTDPLQCELLVGLAAVVSGRVVDAGGAPVAGCVVRAWPSDRTDWRGPEWPSARTEADGGFRLRTSADGGCEVEALVLPDVDGHQRHRLPARLEVVLRAGQELVLPPLVLVDGHSIEGVVTDRQGGRVAGALVCAALHSGGGAPDLVGPAMNRTRTKLDGSFEIGGLPKGEYAVCALAGDGRACHPLVAWRQRNAVKLSAPASGVALRLEESCLGLQLLGDAGVPPERAQVYVWSPDDPELPDLNRHAYRCWTGHPDTEGRLRLAVEPGLTYQCIVLLEGHRRATLSVKISERTEAALEVVRLTAESSLEALSVRLLGPGDQAVGRAWFSLESLDGRSAALVRQLSAYSGLFELNDLPPGRYRLRVRPGADEWGHGGFFREAVAEVQLPLDDASPLQLAVEPGGRLSVQATDEAGRGLHARCRLLDAGLEEIACEWIASDPGSEPLRYSGRLSQTGPTLADVSLPAGQYFLDVWQAGYQPQRISFESRLWETAVLRVQLSR